MLIHVVKAGDTLWNIANRYGVAMQTVASLNGLSDVNKLVVGLALIIPSAETIYTVQRGDTLYKIAQIYGVTVAALQAANGISDPNSIYTGEELTIPNPEKKFVSVNGYIYFLGDSAVPIIEQNGKDLTYLAPFAYLIRADGTLQAIDDLPAIQAALTQKATPMMAITNFTVSSRGENVAHSVLTDPANTNRLLDEVVAIMNQKGYKGLNIDFENVLPADREAYNAFLEKTVARLHPLGYFVSTALAPKTSATQRGPLYEAHDYAAHGRIADFVVLMTYEWGYRKGPPQAISPLDQIKKVLDYAVTVIPRRKIYFGFQIYARDWKIPFTSGTEAQTISNLDAQLRALRYGATIHYDTKAQSPYYRYTDNAGQRHEVWFEDARSAQAKFNVVKEYGLAGISYWTLGYPFPQNWALLEANFNINKRA